MTFDELSNALGHLSQPEFLYVGGAALVLAFILVLLVRRQPKNVVAYTTDNGRVMVSRHAIVELVQTSCEQLQDVSKPQVKILVKGATAHFEVRIKLLSGGRLRTVEETLQAHLRKALTENLGIENLGQINIVATGFKSGRIESSIQTKAEPKVETVDLDPEAIEDSTDLEPEPEIEKKA